VPEVSVSPSFGMYVLGGETSLDPVIFRDGAERANRIRCQQ
jgi:hypothetical protein